MQASPIVRANHTGFTVSDLPKVAAFFRDVLGFKLTEPALQRGEAVEKMVGVPGAVVEIVFAYGSGYTVELMQYHKPHHKKVADLDPCDTGFAHISFEVADIEEVSKRVTAAGYPPISPPQLVPAGPRKGGWNVYVRGPDNVAIEFQVAPPGFVDFMRAAD